LGLACLLALAACKKPEDLPQNGTRPLNAAEVQLAGTVGARVWRWQASLFDGRPAQNSPHLVHERYILMADRRFYFLHAYESLTDGYTLEPVSGQWQVAQGELQLFYYGVAVPFYRAPIVELSPSRCVYETQLLGRPYRTVWVLEEG
jgi:hypothetical protein